MLGRQVALAMNFGAQLGASLQFSVFLICKMGIDMEKPSKKAHSDIHVTQLALVPRVALFSSAGSL